MKQGEEIYPMIIYTCTEDWKWYFKHKGEPINVSESGEAGEWYIIDGEHEGKHVDKKDCRLQEMTLADMEIKLLKKGA